MANYASFETMGDPRKVSWQSQNLVRVQAPNGQVFTVNKDAAPAFTGFLKDLADTGYDIKSDGGFNIRKITGGTGLSQHSFGNAIDINAAANPYGSPKHNLPDNVQDLASKHGLEWGGKWGTPDPMHFEWRGPNGEKPTADQTASAASLGGASDPNRSLAVYAGLKPAVPSGGLLSNSQDATPSPIPFPQLRPDGLLAQGATMPSSIDMGPQASLNTMPSAYASFTQPQVQQAVQNYAAADAANADAATKKKFDFAGLASLGGQLMAAGAPRQTWQPGAPAQIHRPQMVNFMQGLLG